MLKNPDIIPRWMVHAAEIRIEMEMADTARNAGNEGRARVCARRAAGLAARDFLSLHLVNPDERVQDRSRSNSAIGALQSLAAFPGLATDLKRAAVNLTMRVTPDFQLPDGIDLIDEAHKLIGGLK
jgi:hypothetical protein